MIDWGSITPSRTEKPAPPRPPQRKSRPALSPYLVPLWNDHVRKPRDKFKLSRRAEKTLKKLQPPEYLHTIPFEYDRIGRPTQTWSLLHDDTARNHYKVYTSKYKFAFNTSCIFEVTIPGKRFKFFGIALDFYQMKHHLINMLLPNGDAPNKIQNMYRDVGHDSNKLTIRQLQLCTPFVAQEKSTRAPMPFDKYVSAMRDRRNGWALKHVLWIVRDIRLLNMWMLRWKAQHALAQNAYMEELNTAALRIQLAWRRKQGSMVLHMKRRLKAEQDEMERAAIMIQNAWRRKNAKSMVANMKKKMMDEEAEMNAAALRIQLAWRRKQGSMVLHMKRRLKAEQDEQRRKEINSCFFLQYVYRKNRGLLHLHMRCIAERFKQEWMEELHTAALYIQYIYRRSKGLVPMHLKRMARQFAEDERKRYEQAATYIQYIYRKKKGLLALHLQRQARMRVQKRRRRKNDKMVFESMPWKSTHWSDMLTNIAGDDVFENLGGADSYFMSPEPIRQYDTTVWEACWDTTYSRAYFYNTITGESQWEEPPP